MENLRLSPSLNKTLVSKLYICAYAVFRLHAGKSFYRGANDHNFQHDNGRYIHTVLWMCTSIARSNAYRPETAGHNAWLTRRVRLYILSQFIWDQAGVSMHNSTGDDMCRSRRERTHRDVDYVILDATVREREKLYPKHATNGTPLPATPSNPCTDRFAARGEVRPGEVSGAKRAESQDGLSPLCVPPCFLSTHS